jgi:hypothetical protein
MLTRRWLSGVLAALALGLLAVVWPARSDSQARPSNPHGQSRTMLANGKWLLTGGTTDSGTPAPAVILETNSNDIEVLSGELVHDHSWHTATLLPDGKVLIAGGVDRAGHVIADPEVFDPERQSFAPAPSTGLSARAYHSATLLTDGTVLLAGGVSDNNTPLSSADLWDFRTKTGKGLTTEMMPLGRRPISKLLPDGTVLLSTRTAQAAYEPWRLSFLPAHAESRDASLRENRGADVPLGAAIAIRFSKRLRAESLNSGTVALSDGVRHIDARIVPAEQGMLVFITPTAPLALATRYLVKIDGAKDESGSVFQYAASLRIIDGQQQTRGPIPPA